MFIIWWNILHRCPICRNDLLKEDNYIIPNFRLNEIIEYKYHNNNIQNNATEIRLLENVINEKIVLRNRNRNRYNRRNVVIPNNGNNFDVYIVNMLNNINNSLNNAINDFNGFYRQNNDEIIVISYWVLLFLLVLLTILWFC